MAEGLPVFGVWAQTIPPTPLCSARDYHLVQTELREPHAQAWLSGAAYLADVAELVLGQHLRVGLAHPWGPPYKAVGLHRTN